MGLTKQLTADKMSVEERWEETKPLYHLSSRSQRHRKRKAKVCLPERLCWWAISQGPKNVILLSSIHKDGRMVLRKYHKTVPEVVDFYNSTEDGVDSFDLMAHSMTTKRQTKKWPMVVFFNILDMTFVHNDVVQKKLKLRKIKALNLDLNLCLEWKLI